MLVLVALGLLAVDFVLGAGFEGTKRTDRRSAALGLEVAAAPIDATKAFLPGGLDRRLR